MDIKASDVKKLREKTGAGMLDCKNALVEAQGDFAKAEKILKELGLAAAAKRSGRATNEGRVFTQIIGDKASIVEVSCETDFVARNQGFIDAGNNLAKTAVEKNYTAINDELESLVKDLITKIKENMSLKRLAVVEKTANDLLVDYIHGDGKIGVIVKLTAENADALSKDEVKELAFNCALHIAAFNPTYLSKDKVEADYIKEQEEIFTKQAEGLGKPEKVIAGIIKGKMNKHLSEICFLDQGYVKEDKKSVSQILKEVGKTVGSNLNITEFLYYRVGEEI